MTYLDPKTTSRVDEKLARLNNLRPLPSSAVKKLREQFEIEMTYNSNAIEGNSLTLKETFLVINEGLTIKGKPLKDHLEVKDHHEALEMVYELVGPDSQPTFSEHLVRSLHQLVMKKTDEEFAGKYRTSNVFIGGADHTPPDSLQVSPLMKQFMSWFSREKKRIHPIELAALAHHELVYIHPFFDGNGRTARLVMNIILMRHGYPLAVILKNDRRRYYRSLDLADKGDLTPMVKFVNRAVERSLDIYLKTLSPGSKQNEVFHPLSEISRQVVYSTKYLNLLSRLGKLEAHKQGRNWLTTVEAVQRYIDSKERVRKPSR
ncbi:MAG: Fic family protein [Candidatus Pacebacteria bacterium]|nr:Fic family protein [Candidatus Paceibacterota bacterium]